MIKVYDRPRHYEIAFSFRDIAQELLQNVAQTREWEFAGWWNNWNLDQPIGRRTKPDRIDRPIVLLRRRQ